MKESDAGLLNKKSQSLSVEIPELREKYAKNITNICTVFIFS